MSYIRKEKILCIIKAQHRFNVIEEEKNKDDLLPQWDKGTSFNLNDLSIAENMILKLETSQIYGSESRASLIREIENNNKDCLTMIVSKIIVNDKIDSIICDDFLPLFDGGDYVYYKLMEKVQHIMLCLLPRYKKELINELKIGLFAFKKRGEFEAFGYHFKLEMEKCIYDLDLPSKTSQQIRKDSNLRYDQEKLELDKIRVKEYANTNLDSGQLRSVERYIEDLKLIIPIYLDINYLMTLEDVQIELKNKFPKNITVVQEDHSRIFDNHDILIQPIDKAWKSWVSYSKLDGGTVELGILGINEMVGLHMYGEFSRGSKPKICILGENRNGAVVWYLAQEYNKFERQLIKEDDDESEDDNTESLFSAKEIDKLSEVELKSLKKEIDKALKGK